QQKSTYHLQVMPPQGGKPDVAKDALILDEDVNGFSWTRDGQLLYASGNRLMQLSSAGKEKSALPSDNTLLPMYPTACPDGRHVVFSWPHEANKLNVWRVDLDGSSPRRLTFGSSDYALGCSPDSKWAAYASSADGV